MKEITGHNKQHNAIDKKDGYYKSHNGNLVPKRTTRGWDFCVEWADGSTSFVLLKDIKIANPVEAVKYAVANDLQDEPAFKWWVKYTLENREKIISKV